MVVRPLARNPVITTGAQPSRCTALGQNQSFLAEEKGFQ